MSTNYEWCVEVVEVYDEDTNDIVELLFQGSYADCLKATVKPLEGLLEYHIVLVCDYDKGGMFNAGRAWAYMVDGKLPEHFEDANGAEVHKVPQRFHKEIESTNKQQAK